MTSRALAFFALLLVLVAGAAGAQTQQGASPVADMLARGKNALNDLKYHEADSLAHQALALGALISPDEQIAAMQISAAALYPEEAGEQKTDSAVKVIKQLIKLGGKEIPHDISWPGLDSLVAYAVRASQPGKLLLGSRTPGAVLYVNDVAQGVLHGLRVVPVSPNEPVRLSIRVEKCTNWDSTVVVKAADSVRVGFRNPSCSP